MASNEEHSETETGEDGNLSSVDETVDAGDVGAPTVDDTVDEEADDAVDEETDDAVDGEADDAVDEEADDDEQMDMDEEDDGQSFFETMGRDDSRQALYALLFASDRPMNATRLAEAISEDMDPEVVTMLLEELRDDLNNRAELPYFLKEIGGGYQLLTKATYAPFIRRLYQIKKSKRLSKAVLETLAIIAYKQPTTRAEVEAIRGVSVSHAFEQLQERRFIKVSGVADLPGRPKLYRTTEDFLVQFGMGSLKELPTLEELQEMR